MSTLRSFIVLISLLAYAGLAWGDGFIVIHDAPQRLPGHFAFAPLEVTYHHVETAIDEQVAATSIDQEFHNPNNARLEGTYIFPLPVGAHIDKFSMDINGRMAEAELLSADKARSLYEDIVRKMRDPALLEYVGRDAFKVRIFPIEPNSNKRVQIKYTQLLKSDSGLIEYTYPLSTEKYSSRPLRDVSVKVTLACKHPIKALYSPSHSVEIKRHSDTHAVIGYEDKNVRPDTDFKLLFSTARDPVSIDLLSYRNSPDDGYFLLLASPGVDVSQSMIQPKDICFVLDTSGSMAGAKMEQAKKALNFCLANLNPEDRFEIIRFSTESEPLFNELTTASNENVSRARAFVDKLKPIGGTAIADALSKALSEGAARHFTGPMRPFVVIFLTDGQPTVGETNEDKLVSLVNGPTRDLGPGTRIFTFGIGTDINTHLLDRLANETRAVSQYVLPEEDIEVKVSNFYSKIQSPVLTDIKVELADGAPVHLSQMYPPSMPDLFKGDTLMLFGRYALDGRREAPMELTLSGTLAGKPQKFTAQVNFARNDMTNGFIPRLWATRRVGWLLDEIRMHGESTELKDEVTSLAREHGIVTPYTAYLILEDEKKRGVPIALQNMRELDMDGVARDRAKEWYDSSRADSKTLEKAGRRAVVNAANAHQLKFSYTEQQAQVADGLVKSLPALSAGAEGGYRVASNYTQQARVINGRAFYQNANVWTDSTAQAKKALKQQQIKFNSAEYFALLSKHPAAAQWLSLGTDVDVVLEDTLYQIRG